MLFEIENTGKGYSVSSRRLTPRSAADLGLLEKDIENWVADHPEVLLPNEQVLVIGQSIAGQSMADVLALDSFGRLIIVEIKRHQTDRETIAQLLGYAARLHGASYEKLNGFAQNYRNWQGGELYTVFSEFSDTPDITREELGKEHRVVIVAPDSDADLKGIVGWLSHYEVPVELVPFSVYADEQQTPRFLQIEGVTATPEPVPTDEVWLGHWIFNTNEAYAAGAYERMFECNVAAIYGKPSGPKTLEGAEPGNKVLAYVNRHGLCALGTVSDGEVHPGVGVFVDEQGEQLPGEYHLTVNWEVVLPLEEAVSTRDAKQLGYNLPVRTVFGRLHSGRAAQKLEDEICSRST